MASASIRPGTRGLLAAPAADFLREALAKPSLAADAAPLLWQARHQQPGSVSPHDVNTDQQSASLWFANLAMHSACALA
jgi:hypothetical protein